MRPARRILALAVLLLIGACSGGGNPFFSDYDTPFGVPPFDKIKEQHYMPAFEEGMKRQAEEIKAIAENPDEPTFENTVEAVEYSGDLLRKVSDVFFSLNSAVTSDGMQKIAKDVAPMLSSHRDDIMMNAKLFERFKTLYDKRDDLGLNEEQSMLLERYYKDFIRNGAGLSAADKERLREINGKLSVLTIKFGENVLKETNSYEMVLSTEDELDGLPDWVLAGAAEAAADKGYEGKWLFTLQKPSMLPFLQYSKNRALREKIFKAYMTRCNHGDEVDNKDNVEQIIALRQEKARMLGFDDFASFALDDAMAKTPDKVYSLLDDIWKPALLKAKEEESLLQAMVYRQGDDFEIEPWDWWYYAEKLKKQQYDLDDEVLKPYFPLESVLNGAFTVVNRLYGLTFEERKDIPVYHEGVRVFEVKEEDGTHVGLFYIDYFPRESKRGGAWMGSFRKQYRDKDGRMVTPIIYNVGNFSKPAGDMPSLLNFDEVHTLFHELGHGLQGLLSDGTYPTLTGTAVATDFVELPSQIMENWATDPTVLKMYAKNYKTGEPITDDLIAKIEKARFFNQGFAATEYLAASYLDMDWHTRGTGSENDVNGFEKASMDRIGLIPQIVVRYRTPYFRHIFSGGYAAGYYSYIWAEVLDADAFEAFKENGLFDRKTAQSFRDNILSKGGSADPMELYIRFRGREPEIEPLLKRRGLD